MRFFYLLIFLFAICMPDCFPHGFIEIDLNKREIKFDSFRFGNYSIVADLFFDVRQKDGSLIFSLDGKKISLTSEKSLPSEWITKRNFSWIEMKMLLKDNNLFINYFRSPEFLIRGKIDLTTQELLLDVDGKWQEKSVFLDGNTKISLRIWGRLSDYLVNGTLDVEDGVYRDVEFSKFCVHFLGKPPLFHLTDSQITLRDGSVYEIDGAMDIRDFSNIFPKAVYISKKVALGDWKMLSESDKNVGLRKNVDDNLDVVFDTYDREDQSMETGTEVRYKIKRDQFLRLRMQDDKTIVGFERRKEF